MGQTSATNMQIKVQPVVARLPMPVDTTMQIPASKIASMTVANQPQGLGGHLSHCGACESLTRALMVSIKTVKRSVQSCLFELSHQCHP
jgi:hypothetical protein